MPVRSRTGQEAFSSPWKQCTTVAYALFNLQERGKLFLGPGERVYAGQIIGEHSREADIIVNPAKGKKLTNMRASGSDDAVILTPHVKMTLEECISYINDDELVEITPESIRLRKMILEGLNGKGQKTPQHDSFAAHYLFMALLQLENMFDILKNLSLTIPNLILMLAYQ